MTSLNQKNWLKSIENIVKIISIKFQQYFQNINCVGKIMFKQHENDFTKYRLELWTQFRTDGR